MTKLLGVLLAGLCATGAFAQGNGHWGGHEGAGMPAASAVIPSGASVNLAPRDRGDRSLGLQRHDDRSLGLRDRDDLRIARADRDDHRARFGRFDRDERHYVSRHRDDRRFARWDRSNRHGYLRGEERAEYVHMLNARRHERHHYRHIAYRHHHHVPHVS
jgi:hypothetical protein